MRSGLFFSKDRKWTHTKKFNKMWARCGFSLALQTNVAKKKKYEFQIQFRPICNFDFIPSANILFHSSAVLTLISICPYNNDHASEFKQYKRLYRSINKNKNIKLKLGDFNAIPFFFYKDSSRVIKYMLSCATVIQYLICCVLEAFLLGSNR